MEEKPYSSFKPINIKEVFASKSPGMARWIPGFVFNLISRVLRIDFINSFLSRNGHLEGIPFIKKVFEEFNVKEHIYGLDEIPETGRFIFASNHPLGGFDGMALLKIVSTKLGESRFLTNDILMNIPQLKPLFVPVNKHGGHTREVTKILADAYNSDMQVLIFPSGLASRKIKGKIVDLEWKKHFITKAISYKRDIIPVFFDGKNSNRFYTAAKLRKFFHIKWNLEMFLLPDETVRKQNSEMSVWFGKPIPYTTFDKSKSHFEWANYVRDIVYQLPFQKIKK